jgi:hypothetical protein
MFEMRLKAEKASFSLANPSLKRSHRAQLRFVFMLSKFISLFFNLFGFLMSLIAYLYVMNANANPTNEIELPSTTPSATTPSWLPHEEPMGL